jgi:two-component sensor histidine kinase
LFDGASVREPDFSAGSPLFPARSDTEEFFLVREMHHRLANSFAALTGILRREFRASASPNLQETLDRFEARIVAFGDLHRLLIVGAEEGWISAQSYIEQLCEALAEALLKPLGVRCEVSADAAFFRAEYCELLGLVIAELVTNAAKHAFAGRDDGLVRIEFVSTTDTWTCIVSDNGVWASVTSEGVGSKILGTLLRALGAELVRKSGPRGTSSVVRCPFQPEFSSMTSQSTCAD